ncbi:hypothetical protein ACIPUC_17590 [Streptomyces sp. LARHCF249]
MFGAVLVGLALPADGRGGPWTTPALHLALVVMALLTTALCGPLLWAIDRRPPPDDAERSVVAAVRGARLDGAADAAAQRGQGVR